MGGLNGRRQHLTGRRHINNKIEYYQMLVREKGLTPPIYPPPPGMVLPMPKVPGAPAGGFPGMPGGLPGFSGLPGGFGLPRPGMPPGMPAGQLPGLPGLPGLAGLQGLKQFPMGMKIPGLG